MTTKSNKSPASSGMDSETKAELVKKAHRQVSDTICTLVDAVEENFLLEKLHVLDFGSWNEIVEERYLARICGLPTCSANIQRQDSTGRRYKFDRRETKIYAAIPQYEKFCSTECYEKSCHIQRQLHEEPLWFNLNRRQKQYSLELDSSQRNQKLQRRPEDIFVDETDRLLLTRLNELKITDRVDSASENEDEFDEDDATTKTKQKEEDAQFLNEIRSFVTSVGQITAKSNANAMGLSSNTKIPKSPQIQPATSKQDEQKLTTSQSKEELAGKSSTQSPKVQSADTPAQNSPSLSDKQMEEKLAKLRQKYAKPNQPTKKAPQLIEAPRLDPKKAAELSENLR
ncbi:RNA polymerase II subunit B1 CTD phosphatase RPAP2-like protein [Aphelenchoides bicaudatus]|nr:RNA polymerase II subunit B1 CTD phosphatase RPAP2-like protein [Aphelenchoides bicaudatus]